ncbi:helix-turn-helix transcriptional regulator [Streptomyces avidinii]|uniref:DNA-binding transcriptional regulator YafY n=1 Tax=Streptomyces avidinii TaxID=1895 RepID=A0ABS4KWC0_STRAV|nr:WYL domain-containing protein [Streptomyces avidinii]MBP2034300.1 putative DNA-binding transcriptional regulator YafY [Streptomyces avidinii]GGZ35638.1 transcriptional regulator [Streptomyces avidinii]
MRAARLIRMALLIQSRPGLTAAVLARELEISERTVIRDAQALQEAGIPVRSERGRSGGYFLAPGYRTRLTTLHPSEAETLFLSGLPSALRDLGLSDAAGTARLKLTATLLPSLREAAESSVRRFHLDAPAWFREPAAPELLPELARAVWADRAVELAYARPGQGPEPGGAAPATVSRVVEPYGLVLKAGTWYVVARIRGAREERDGGWRTYRVDRITALAPAPGAQEPFVRQASFDLAAHWEARSAAFARTLLRTTVTVRLTAGGLRRLPAVVDGAAVEDALASATVPDAAGRVTLDLPTESEDVALDQLARLGADAEVLAPASLRTRFRERAAALAALYTGAEGTEGGAGTGGGAGTEGGAGTGGQR